MAAFIAIPASVPRVAAATTPATNPPIATPPCPMVTPVLPCTPVSGDAVVTATVSGAVGVDGVEGVVGALPPLPSPPAPRPPPLSSSWKPGCGSTLPDGVMTSVRAYTNIGLAREANAAICTPIKSCKITAFFKNFVILFLENIILLYLISIINLHPPLLQVHTIIAIATIVDHNTSTLTDKSAEERPYVIPHIDFFSVH